MTTQMTSARRGVATDEMKQVAKDEDVSLDWLIPKIARGSIIIPSNNVRPQKIHNVGIGKGMKTKVNVNIGTSTLNVNLDEEIEKAKVFEFNNYKSLVSAELELIQRVFEIRQNFTNSSDSERLVEPILQRISKIKSEKLIFEQEFNLI